jgi:hypothetical protein
MRRLHSTLSNGVLTKYSSDLNLLLAAAEQYPAIYLRLAAPQPAGCKAAFTTTIIYIKSYFAIAQLVREKENLQALMTC